MFTLIALCFVLPFATVSYVGGCESSGEPGDASFTGIQLVTRTVPAATGADSERYARQLASYVEHTEATAAEIAFAAAIVGLALGLLGVAGGPGLCAAVGLGAVIQLPFAIGEGYEWRSHPGYWLTLGVFAWAWLLHVFRWTQRRRIAGGRSPAYWIGVGAGMVGLNVLLIFSVFALHAFALMPLLLAVGAAVFLYIRRWRTRKRLGAANSASYWELVVAGAVAIYLSLIVGVLIHALWAVPLLWAGGIGFIRLVKEANAKPESATLP